MFIFQRWLYLGVITCYRNLKVVYFGERFWEAIVFLTIKYLMIITVTYSYIWDQYFNNINQHNTQGA